MPEIYLVRVNGMYVTGFKARYATMLWSNGESHISPSKMDQIKLGPLNEAEIFIDDFSAQTLAKAIGGIVLKVDHWEPVKADE